jgi:hypothetical protein
LKSSANDGPNDSNNDGTNPANTVSNLTAEEAADERAKVVNRDDPALLRGVCNVSDHFTARQSHSIANLHAGDILW